MNKQTDWREKLRELGFGNQAVIVGAKRGELFDWISQNFISKEEYEANQLAWQEVKIVRIKKQIKEELVREVSKIKTIKRKIYDILVIPAGEEYIKKSDLLELIKK